MKVRIEITLSPNMRTGFDISEALALLAADLFVRQSSKEVRTSDEFKLVDKQGNQIGRFWVEE